MSKFAFIGTFILGGIVGIVGEILFGKCVAGMTFDEMSRAGNMLIDGGRNRDSALALHKPNGEIETLMLTQK